MSSRRIGIIGGVGPSATILYYRQIIEGFRKQERKGHHPEIIIYSLDIGEINDYFEKEEYDPLCDKLVTAVEGLHGLGCDFALFSCNTMHVVFDRVQERVQIPMINLIESVIDEVKSRQLKTVGLMGTTFVMRGGLYRRPLEELGITCLVPEEGEQEWIMQAILKDLQEPLVPESTVRRLLKNIEMLGGSGAEAVILACTDLPVAINEENSPLGLLDSTGIHIRAVLERALQASFR
ncbi:MAG: amino acid racemase [Deltaproteobacteria bacterium]|nr:amino acid racemase [Deltaproteobacteria bacterium]